VNTPVYRIGDLVRITFEGYIDEVDESDPHRYGVRIGQYGKTHFRTDGDAKKHELVTAAEWPPQPGDAWADGRGKDWFAHTTEEDGTGIALTSEFGARFEDQNGLDEADRLYGPFRLKNPGKRRRDFPGQPPW
jgi:hypothetical protein